MAAIWPCDWVTANSRLGSVSRFHVTARLVQALRRGACFSIRCATCSYQADIMLDANLNDAAGRTAYLAGLHTAQVFILEHTAQARKTHNGVKIAYLRLTKDDPARVRSSGSHSESHCQL